MCSLKLVLIKYIALKNKYLNIYKNIVKREFRLRAKRKKNLTRI